MTRTRNWNGICFPFGTMATEQNPVIACSSPHLPDSMQLGWPAFKDWSFIYLLVPGKCNRREERGKKKKRRRKADVFRKLWAVFTKKKRFPGLTRGRTGLHCKLKRVKNQEMQSSWTDRFFYWKMCWSTVVLISKELKHKKLLHSLQSGNRQVWETEFIHNCKLIVKKSCTLHCEANHHDFLVIGLTALLQCIELCFCSFLVANSNITELDKISPSILKSKTIF